MKMVKIRLWILFLVFVQILKQITGSTHWVVTENGRIQAQIDSPFYLRRPYDLLALLDQETRRNDINALYQDLVARNTILHKKSSGLEGASDLEARIYSQEPECIKAGKLLSEVDLYTSLGANGTGRPGVQLELCDEADAQPDDAIPDCTKYMNLDFSMFAYEHLEAMINKHNMTVTPEKNLEHLMPVPSMKSFGKQISLGLAKNSSSWLHYNMGSLYWRIRGDGTRAIECLRRALFTVPRQYRDIPLLNLAGIFHQSRHSKDAAILLHAAIDHSPLQADNYLALGYVYAVLADYNRSVECYENFLKLNPDVTVLTTKHATLCHKKLESGLMELHESLQDILTDLHDYHSQQQQWLRLQERMMWEQAPYEAQLLGYNSDKIGSLLANRGQRCVQKMSKDSKPTISCDFTDNQLASNLQFDVSLNLQRLLQNVESETQKINEQMLRNKNKKPLRSTVKEKPLIDTKETKPENKLIVNSAESKNSFTSGSEHMPNLDFAKYPNSISMSNNLYFDATGWPTKEECEEWNLPTSEVDDLDIPVFMSPENKGYQVTKMLSDYIDLPEWKEHELPWYPPLCEIIEGEEKEIPLALRSIIKELKGTPYLKKLFLGYINNGNSEEAEIGQRIITAMNKKTGPTWVLTTIASLYWRVRSNTKNALNCLALPHGFVPKEHSDVVLISMASILHQSGLVDEAIRFASLAFKVNFVEPSTNFLLALLHYSKNNPLLAMYYMKNVLRVEPDFYEGKADLLLKTWACRIKLGTYKDHSKTEKVGEGMCSEKEAFNGEGVVCSANGEQCKTASLHCVKTDDSPEYHDSDSTTSQAKVLVNHQCTKSKVGFSPSTLNEGSGGTEPDQSQLESMADSSQQSFHMRITLGDDQTLSDINLVTYEPLPEATFQIHDKTGSYQLSYQGCKDLKDTNWFKFESLWQAYLPRNIDISSYLKALPKNMKDNIQPFCTEAIPSSPATLDHLIAMVLRNRLPSLEETSLYDWLGLMTGDQHSSIQELGARIGIALQENTTSWLLATAAALYWRVVGNTEQAVTCLRQALNFVPNDKKDIPLVSLADVLHRVGFHLDALEVVYRALESYPDFVVNQFTAGNIHTTLGDIGKAITFYRTSLQLDPNFEPARYKLQSILCTFLYDDNGSLRDPMDIIEN